MRIFTTLHRRRDALALWLALLVMALGLAVIIPRWWSPADGAVTGKVAVAVDLKDIRTSGAEQATLQISREFAWTVASGTGANQVNLCWQSVRTLTTGANEDLDVSGSLTTTFGAAVFTKVKFIAISADAANTTTLTVSRPATNGLVLFAAASDALAPLKAGAFFAFSDPSSAGVTVTAATGDLLNVTNSAGATATYTIVVCGLS